MVDVSSIIRAAWSLYNAGDLKGANSALQRAMKHAPRDAAVLQARAAFLFGERKLVEAEYFARQAAAVGGNHVACHHTLASILQAAGKLAEAEAAYGDALRCAPGHAEVLVGLAEVRKLRKNFRGAEDALRLALAAGGAGARLARVSMFLAGLLRQTGRPEESMAVLDSAVARVPGHLELNVQSAVASNYVPMEPSERCARLTRAGDLLARAAGKPVRPPENLRDPDRPLRIGYVSPDLREHSVSYFIEPILRSHDRANFHVTCYFGAPKADAVTALLRSHVPAWRDVLDMKDDAFCELVRRDKIDILVDLAGHEPLNRLAAFASRLAPVQVTYLGFASTTGLRAIDFRLVDAITDPPGSEEMAVENLVRLSPCFVCYAPRHRLAVNGPPSGLGGRVTFGSFNTLMKLCTPTIAAWSAVLSASLGSRLLLKAAQFADASVRARVRSEFAACGVEGERVEFIEHSDSIEDHLLLYSRVDIALDSLTYNGTTTTCEALWMGVPVVTMRGNAHAARVGASLLSCVGLGELVAEDQAGFVRIAATLAADRDRLVALRASMRARMERSELMNAGGFTARLESAYRALWRVWCSKPGPPPVPR